MSKLSNIFSTLFLILFVASSLSAQEKDITINVMTYNIQQGTHYNPQSTPKAVSEIVLKNKIDLLGSQELHIDGVKSLSALLSGYGWFGVGRENGKELGETGVIFYNKEMFELLEQSTFWLSETPNVIGSKSWNSADIRIVTWGKFLLLSDSSIVYLFNTHFDHISSLARQESSKLLLKKIDEIAGKNPVIVTGDFNMTSADQEYKILVDYYYYYLQMYDTKYKSINGSTGPAGTFNDFLYDNPSTKIDFIFANPFFDVLTNEVIPDKYEGNFISDHFPVKVQVKLKHPLPPVTPVLKAVAGNNKVSLYWDDVSEKETIETFADSTKDFQGYKLYKSKTPDMKDALLVEGKWNVPLLRKPLFECDLIDDKYGYTNYGIVGGFGYYLGSNSGLQHYYVDEDVRNEETYYYVLIAFDHGIPNMADGFPPMETPFVLEVDASGNIISKSSNVDSAKPEAPQQGSDDKSIIFENDNIKGTGNYSVRIIDPSRLVNGRYKIKFDVDTLNYNAVPNPKYRSNRDLYLINSGINIVSLENDSVIYKENSASYSARNIDFNPYLNYYFLNTSTPVVTEETNGFQIILSNLVEKAVYDSVKSGWKIGNANINVTPSSKEAFYFPWNCEIRFGELYTGRTSTLKSIYDTDGSIIAFTQLLLKQNFDFSVVSKDFPDEKLDLIVFDADADGVFNYEKDKVLAGYCVELANKVYWAGTVFSISFENASGNLPSPGDLYEIFFKRPFLDSDEIIFKIDTNVTSADAANDKGLSTDFSLSQNYPNPFNPSTTISYTLQVSGYTTLKVYDILGREIATLVNEFKQAGKYNVEFRTQLARQGGSAELPSGIYFYTLQISPSTLSASSFRQTKKMLLIK
ncbi:MAG: endonuclease/exonuclease/phosphatase family protein [Ignavibacteriales bacterium]|nr:endonuclease/exonuclease/phosphatase family protein [Ignavibacteriales bacterium]